MTRKRKPGAPGMSCPISRRDFVNGVLAGSGAALLSAKSPASVHADPATQYAPSGSPWTGYGGIGDYRWSNGNTEAVRDAAHGIRDHLYPEADLPVEESHDLVVIGGGFSGTTAAYEFAKHRKPGQPVWYWRTTLSSAARLSRTSSTWTDIAWSRRKARTARSRFMRAITSPAATRPTPSIYRELGMPSHYDLEPLAGGAEKYNLPNDHFDPMMLEKQFATGYYFKGHGWVKNPIAAGFANTPWPAAVAKRTR